MLNNMLMQSELRSNTREDSQSRQQAHKVISDINMTMDNGPICSNTLILTCEQHFI